jgi:hypothetical protein
LAGARIQCEVFTYRGNGSPKRSEPRYWAMNRQEKHGHIRRWGVPLAVPVALLVYVVLTQPYPPPPSTSGIALGVFVKGSDRDPTLLDARNQRIGYTAKFSQHFAPWGSPRGVNTSFRGLSSIRRPSWRVSFSVDWSVPIGTTRWPSSSTAGALLTAGFSERDLHRLMHIRDLDVGFV